VRSLEKGSKKFCLVLGRPDAPEKGKDYFGLSSDRVQPLITAYMRLRAIENKELGAVKVYKKFTICQQFK